MSFLLIIETTLATVLSFSKLSEQHVWDGVIIMLVLFGIIVVIDSLLVWKNPKNLLYGKEEHANPALDISALTDGVEELIAKNVKPECLKPPLS